jgi:hypothetical protein
MTKQAPQKAAPARASKKASSGSYQVVGTLPDGVKVLKPKSKPTHFTSKQIRSTILEIRRKADRGEKPEA